MRALLDVNILLALLDPDHLRHGDVRSWYAGAHGDGWASCPLSQNGFLRIISQRSYSRPLKIGDALVALRAATSRAEHEFWPDDFTVLDAAHVDHTRLLGPKQITDVYLLALAVKHGGQFVTLDSGISYRAARGGRPENLVVL